jgi:hypothetical protein
MTSDLYETDFHQWTVEQSQLLALGKLEGLDLENLAEEIASLGKQQQQELRNRLGVLLGHLLKWEYQTDKRSKSWVFTIREQRRELTFLIADNPSLKSYLDEAILRGYAQGFDLAVKETNLKRKDLPLECPYNIEQIFDVNFPDDIDRDFD